MGVLQPIPYCGEKEQNKHAYAILLFVFLCLCEPSEFLFCHEVLLNVLPSTHLVSLGCLWIL